MGERRMFWTQSKPVERTCGWRPTSWCRVWRVPPRTSISLRPKFMSSSMIIFWRIWGISWRGGSTGITWCRKNTRTKRWYQNFSRRSSFLPTKSSPSCLIENVKRIHCWVFNFMGCDFLSIGQVKLINKKNQFMPFVCEKSTYLPFICYLFVNCFFHSSIYTTLASISRWGLLRLCFSCRLILITPISRTIRTPAKQPFCISILWARWGFIFLMPNATKTAIKDNVVQFTLLSTLSMIFFFRVSSWTCSWDLYFYAWIQFQSLTTGGRGSSYFWQMALTFYGKMLIMPLVEMIYCALGWIF